MTDLDPNDSASEAYLSDAQGRQVTPRISATPNREEPSSALPTSTSRARGRPPKIAQEQEARDARQQMIAHKKRVGGPGMDRGGASLVNDKRRKGLIENDDDEDDVLVDAED